MKERVWEVYARRVLVCVGVILGTQLVCGMMGRPWDLMVCWTANVGAAMMLCLDTRNRALGEFPYPVRTALVDARLLLDGGCRVNGICLPGGTVQPPPATPGPSMLLLTSASALLISPEAQSESQQAVLGCLEGMRVHQRNMINHSPWCGDIQQDGLTWHVYRDGRTQRAFAMGSADELLPLCGLAWQHHAVPFDRAERAALQSDCARQSIPPLCFATAPVERGKLGEPAYLGTFFFEQTLRQDAEAEVASLRSAGLNVSLTGMDPLALTALARRLGCATICPDRKPLRLVPPQQPEEATLSILPGVMSLSGEVRLLMHYQRRFHMQPWMMTAAISLYACCCLVMGLPALTVGVLHLVMLLPTLLVMLCPKVTPQLSAKQHAWKLAMALLPSVAALAVCRAFFAATGEPAPGALFLALLPGALVWGCRDMLRASRVKPGAVAIVACVMAAAGVGVALLFGTGVLPAVFALLAGGIAALPGMME